MTEISLQTVHELEIQAGSLRGEKAKTLKDIVAQALSKAEADHASSELIDRLDGLLVTLTEASREVCTNTKCPHYSKKCKMR